MMRDWGFGGKAGNGSPTAIPCSPKCNTLLVDSRLIGRLRDDRFAMVVGSLLRIAMINAKQHSHPVSVPLIPNTQEQRHLAAVTYRAARWIRARAG